MVKDNGRGIVLNHPVEPLYGDIYMPREFCLVLAQFFPMTGGGVGGRNLVGVGDCCGVDGDVRGGVGRQYWRVAS